MRARVLASCLVLVAGLASCIVQTPPAEPQPGAGEGQANGEGQAGAPGQAGGSCDGACSHYLGCRGSDDTFSHAGCVAQCDDLQPTPQDLATYQTLDCPTAISVVENGEGYGAGGGEAPTSSAPAGGGADCSGCAWDGAQCMASPSNAGPGDSAGAASTCDPSCCGH